MANEIKKPAGPEYIRKKVPRDKTEDEMRERIKKEKEEEEQQEEGEQLEEP